MMTQPKPIEWQEVAMVGFEHGRPVIITSVEPRVLFDTWCSLLPEDSDSWIFGENDKISKEAVEQRIAELDWKLYPVEDAKTVFCSAKPRAKESQHATQPLPGQKSLPGFAD